MFLLIKWLAIPLAVLAVAVWFAVAGWFANLWVATGYGLAAVAVLFLWRHAASRLEPSARSARERELDTDRKRRLTIGFTVLHGLGLAVALAAILWLAFAPAAHTTSGAVIALVVIVWQAIVRRGLLDVFAHRVLQE